MIRLFLMAAVFASRMITATAAEREPIRFGLTAVVVRENLRFFDNMTTYLARHLGQPVEFVRRKSYREIMNLMANGDLDFAWICGYPLIQKREPEFLTLLTVPVYKSKPFYRSFIIVHKDSKLNSIDDLSGKVFAYSDPDSNSGYLYPRYHLSMSGHEPDSYFRKFFFTYNHAETIQAVAARFADGGAVESYIWEFLQKTDPDLVAQTRVIHASPEFGFPPIVSRLGNSSELVRKMSRTLAGMKNTEDGRKLLRILHLDGFGNYSLDLYDNIRTMQSRVQNGKEISKATSSGTGE